jgi:cell division protein FtsL
MSNTRSRSRSGRSRRSGSRGKRSSTGGGRRRTGGRKSGSNWSRHGTALPGWTDLEPPSNTRTPEPSDETFLEKISTVRFAAIVLLVATAFTMYVGHVHATKNLLGQVQEARAENQRLHLKRNRLQGEFARKTSPSVIYERAREMGLEESVTYGPPVRVE